MGRQPTHGVAGYTKRRCRCEQCVQAWNMYMREYRSRRSRRSRGGYYEGKRPGTRVRLTELGLGILRARAARTGMAPDDLVEQALRHAC